MHPREEPIHIVQLALVDVLVNKQWRRRPVVYRRPDFPPIGASALGKHKNQGPAIVTEICAVRGRHRANVILICILQVADGVVGRVLLVFALVVHQSGGEIVLRSHFLQPAIAFVFERIAPPIPIDNEPGDSKIFGFFDLLRQHPRILRRVAHIHVVRLAKPRLVSRQNLWSSARR